MKWNLNRRIRFFLALSAVVFTLLAAFGWLTVPKVVPAEEETRFSAERVVEDLAVIAKEPHSVEHPEARAAVRAYLEQRLRDLGGEMQVYAYDSVAFRYGGHYDIANVYAEFEPVNAPATAYVLFVAHMDSRFRQQVLDRTVYSYGAADDGYGLGVTLELVRDALQYRNEWKQGIKVLFTDSEENDLDGMRNACLYDPQLLDQVGLVINLEARGVKGPALLFETSSGDEKVVDLYAETAAWPVTYSLTSVVYKMMPNFTDFTLLKEDYPGVNFSCLDNINYYHTDLDCLENIEPKTIQHYGSQLEPMLEDYLTDASYADPDALRGEENRVFFTLPGLGMVKMTQGQNRTFAVVTLLLFVLAFALYVKTRNIRPKQVFIKALVILGWGLGILLAAEGLIWVLARCVGTPFSLTATKFIPADQWIGASAVVLTVLAVIAVFVRRTAKRPYFACETLFATLLLMLVFGEVMTWTLGENFFFLVPVLVASVSLILSLFLLLNIFSLPAMMLVLLLAASFLYNLLTALTVGALGIVLLLVFFNALVVCALFENFVRVKVRLT